MLFPRGDDRGHRGLRCVSELGAIRGFVSRSAASPAASWSTKIGKYSASRSTWIWPARRCDS
jgi:hypothetical protein